MKNFFYCIFFISSFSFTTAHASNCDSTTNVIKFYAGVGFDSYFDNREFTDNPLAPGTGLGIGSGTDFTCRFTPYFTIKWNEHNSLIFGAQAYSRYGEILDGGKFFYSVAPLAYYQYRSSKILAISGIFPRNSINIDSYSAAFFSPSFLFYNDRMGGMMASFKHGTSSYTEFAATWEGLKTTTTREKFRILSSGRYKKGAFYAAYNTTLLHYATQADGINNNVIDYILLNPAIGLSSKGAISFDIRVGSLLSAQRDRLVGLDAWLMPWMGEITLELGFRGLKLRNELYLGENMAPLYCGYTKPDGTYLEYGASLYRGDTFFATDKGYYNKTSLIYGRKFFGDTLSVDCKIIVHCNGYDASSQYLLNVGVNLESLICKLK